MFVPFFQSWISGGGRSARSARRRAASPPKKPRKRLTLEALEDRLVPTVVFNPVFGPETYTGSLDGMQNPPVHLIFSGDGWNTASGRQDEQKIITATKSILGGPYLSELKQYGSDGKATYVDSWNTSMSVPVDPTSGTDSTSVQNLLQISISLQSLGTGIKDLPGTADLRHAPIYVVISDLATSNGYNGGWNQQSTYSQATAYGRYNANIHMIWLGTSQNGSSVDVDTLTGGLSHEFAETITDPSSNGNINPPSTLPAVLASPGGNQVGDFEPAGSNQYHYSYRLGSVVVQPYWSIKDNAYIVPDGNAQKFYLQPVWSGTNFSGQYDLNVTLSGTTTQIAIDQSTNPLQTNGIAVKLNSATASFDNSAIRNINVASSDGQHAVNVAGLPSDVTLNVTGGSAQSNDTVTIGSTGSLANISGTVNVSNTSGRTKLIVSDSSDSRPQYVAVTADQVYFGGAQVNYTGAWNATSGVTSLEVDGGKGGNLIDVFDTAANTPLTLNPGARSYGVGSNTVNILGSSSAVTVTSTANDIVTVGNGSLAGIGGPVNVSNVSGGADSLTINDSADFEARSINISGNAVKFAATASQPAVTINYTPPSSSIAPGVNQLTILDGPNANAITVDSVSPQAPVTIDGDTQDTLTGAAADQVQFIPFQS